MADVIAAIASGHQPCAIGILRLSGEGAIAVAAQVFRPRFGQSLAESPNRKLRIGSLLDVRGRVIDEALAVCARAPGSYTGEETVELQCHGSPAVLAAGLEALFAAGARQAGPGEFTKRAFLNGRMDLTQAEAVVDLIDAETADAAANAAGQVGGALVRRLTPVYDALCDIVSHFGAVLDYPDEELEPFRVADCCETLRAACGTLDALLDTRARGRILKHGLRTVLLGRPNVGKSSLLNALAGYDRVIVTDVPGTTRDTVEESVRVGRHLLRLLDTAGIRETADRIERIGVERAEAAAREAELALLVLDGSEPLTDADRRAMEAARACPNAVCVLNKCDLPAAVSAEALPFGTVVSLSAGTGEGLDRLERALDALLPADTPCDGGILTNVRQSDALRRAAEALRSALASLEGGLTPDAALCDVESAMEAIGEVTGRTVREDVVNRIFERFCVGK